MPRHPFQVLPLALVIHLALMPTADAAPSFQLRDGNRVRLDVVAAGDAEARTDPSPGWAFLAKLADQPLDGTIHVHCAPEVADECSVVDRGDAVRVKGEVRVVQLVPESGRFEVVIVADDFD